MDTKIANLLALAQLYVSTGEAKTAASGFVRALRDLHPTAMGMMAHEFGTGQLEIKTVEDMLRWMWNHSQVIM